MGKFGFAELQSSPAETQDMRNQDRKRSHTLGGCGADNGEGQRRFPPPELQSRGERGSSPQEVGSKPDTFKSLHMGTLSRRGAGILLVAVSCQ